MYGKGVSRSLSNIWDGKLKAANYFRKKLPLKCWAGFWILLCMGCINKFMWTSEFFPSIQSWPEKLITHAHVASVQNFINIVLVILISQYLVFFCLNPFHVNAPFLTLLKMSKNQRVSGVLRIEHWFEMG